MWIASSSGSEAVNCYHSYSILRLIPQSLEPLISLDQSTLRPELECRNGSRSDSEIWSVILRTWKGRMNQWSSVVLFLTRSIVELLLVVIRGCDVNEWW